MTRKARRKLQQRIQARAANQKKHTFRRFRERFNINLREWEYLDTIRQIQEGRSLFIDAASKRRKYHLVQVRDFPCTVVYDRLTKQIRTVLPTMTLREVYAA
jgi:phosphopantetheine adenylyltransferase